MNLSDNISLPTTRITITWLLFGLCCGLLLYGVMLCQGYSYFQTYYRKDPLDLRLTVAGILITNAAILGLNTYACFYFAVDLLSCTSGTTVLFTNLRVSICLVIIPLCILFSIVLCEYIYIRRTYFIIYMHPPRRYFLVINSVILVASATGFVTVFEGTTPVIIPLSLVGAKVYASATLVTLNIRQDMSEKLAAPGGSELPGA
ncbi:hypothetical protein V8D89_012865 [Ganoderma adspersum]